MGKGQGVMGSAPSGTVARRDGEDHADGQRLGAHLQGMIMTGRVEDRKGPPAAVASARTCKGCDKKSDLLSQANDPR